MTAAVSVATQGDDLLAAARDALAELRRDGVAAALAGKDPTLWGPRASDEAARRLGWLDVVELSRPLMAEIGELRDQLRAEGLDRVVLAGMGGSSLAPEVIAGNAGVLSPGHRFPPPPARGAPSPGLVVLDSTDPGQVGAALTGLQRTLVVVSSKSGSTIEPDSHRRAFEAAFREAGLSPDEVPARFVVVTDPGSPLERIARESGYRRVFLADPDVGGRYSALTAFGLVPAGLAGADVDALLDEAAAVRRSLGDDGNPGLALGAALGGPAARSGRTTIAIEGGERPLVGFGDWAEQLLAESTGKQGTGLLPVVVGSPDEEGVANAGAPVAPDRHRVVVGDRFASPRDQPAGGTSVHGPLGAQFLVWEYATAIAGRCLGIDPFDQPNVAESKDNTTALLDEAGEGPLPAQRPALTDGVIEGYAANLDLLTGNADVADVADVAGALRALLGSLGEAGYLAVMAYLDRHADASAARLRGALARRTARPVTFGWGPRFLHSTGQYHKGGPPAGSYLQITGTVREDRQVPGRAFTFGKLQAAQALGDLRALAGRGRPVLRLHLSDREAGMAQLLAAAGAS